MRFGIFEFDPDTGELRRDGYPVKLQAQPAKVLAALIAARGEIVTREELRNVVWSDGTTVDFERGLNFAVAQVRTALGDSAESPRFVRTVPKRGYRFIAALPDVPAGDGGSAGTPKLSRRKALPWLAAAGAGAAAAMGTMAVLARWRGKNRIAVALFENETGDPVFDRAASAITDSLVAELTARGGDRFGIIGNAAILRQRRSFQDVAAIGEALDAGFVVLGQVQRDGEGVRVLAHLIRLPEQTHLRVSRQRLADPGAGQAASAGIASDFMARLGFPAAAAN
ncbi:MAG: winged helix-turn-helix domain-containing protein [Bryobacteraceae bacterium]